MKYSSLNIHLSFPISLRSVSVFLKGETRNQEEGEGDLVNTEQARFFLLFENFP